jgi:hypothetical protein
MISSAPHVDELREHARRVAGRRPTREQFVDLVLAAWQWIEAIFDKDELSLCVERHGAHTMDGLCADITQCLLAFGAVAGTT